MGIHNRGEPARPDAITYEICIDSVAGASAAQAAGAQRVELCDNLVDGGTTPSVGMISIVRAQISIGLHVIIRPRGGDFYYSEQEMDVMLADIAAVKAAGADGVVIGLLLPDGQVDVPRTAALVQAARPMRVTFHRAIDLARDPFEAVDAIASLGIERILTSGQSNTALEGAACIASMVRHAAGRVRIMAGGGVNAGNVRELIAATGVQEIHCSGRDWLDSPMQFRRDGVYMGGAFTPQEYRRRATSQQVIEEIIRSAASPPA